GAIRRDERFEYGYRSNEIPAWLSRRSTESTITIPLPHDVNAQKHDSLEDVPEFDEELGLKFTRNHRIELCTTEDPHERLLALDYRDCNFAGPFIHWCFIPQSDLAESSNKRLIQATITPDSTGARVTGCGPEQEEDGMRSIPLTSGVQTEQDEVQEQETTTSTQIVGQLRRNEEIKQTILHYVMSLSDKKGKNKQCPTGDAGSSSRPSSYIVKPHLERLGRPSDEKWSPLFFKTMFSFFKSFFCFLFVCVSLSFTKFTSPYMHCTSVNKTRYLEPLDLAWCWTLGAIRRDERFEYGYRSNEIPAWLSRRSTESTITIPLPHDVDGKSKWIKLALCFICEAAQKHDSLEDVPEFDEELGLKFTRNHRIELCTTEDPHERLLALDYRDCNFAGPFIHWCFIPQSDLAESSNKRLIQATITPDSTGTRVTGCGVSLIYLEDVPKFVRKLNKHYSYCYHGYQPEEEEDGMRSIPLTSGVQTEQDEGKIEVPEACGKVEMLETCGKVEVSEPYGRMEVLEACGRVEMSEVGGIMEVLDACRRMEVPEACGMMEVPEVAMSCVGISGPGGAACAGE
ncbi:hypothetical protein GBA52_024195, partial [Prunus armeniaca]